MHASCIGVVSYSVPVTEFPNPGFQTAHSIVIGLFAVSISSWILTSHGRKTIERANGQRHPTRTFRENYTVFCFPRLLLGLRKKYFVCWHHWFVLILSTNIYFAEMFRKRKSYVPNFLAVVGHFPKSWLWPYFTLRQKVWRDILFYRKQKASISRVTEVPDSIFTKEGAINSELSPIEHIFNGNDPLETLSEEILFTSGYTVKKETCG